MIEKNIERIADALEALVRLAGEGSLSPNPVNTEAKPAKPTKDKKEKQAPAAPIAPAAQDPMGDLTGPGTEAPGETAPTLEDLQDKLKELVAAHKVQQAKDVLAKYKAKKASEVKSEDYINFRKDLDAELKK